MSRARSIEIPGQGLVWFDTSQDGQPAIAEQLELLAAAADIELDDLLDADLTQGQVILAIREALSGPVVPPEVLERKRRRRVHAQSQPGCRICRVEGNSTRHHFIPRWLMRELENYQSYAARGVCTIPLCVACHRDIHARDDRPGKSIVGYLRDYERALAARMLDDLKEQHPKMFDLISGGDDWTYEGVLMKDYRAGKFHIAEVKEARSAHWITSIQQAGETI